MSHPTPPELSALMTAFENACRQADLKVTHQRLEIYRELAQAEDHPSAEMLYKRILARLPTISLDTVYRTLATLEKHGLITRLQTAENQARFEAKMASHHHVVCRRCGAINDFNWPRFDETPLPTALATWGKISHRHAVFEGICQACGKPK
jgi:Fur family peroxide stress response transcriptional regulator